MIRLLTPEEARPVIEDFAARLEPRDGQPVNPSFLAAAWCTLMKTGARVYALYDNGDIHGVLLGSIIPDLFSGRNHGLEFLWLVAPGRNGLPLLRAFEDDCRKAECFQIVAGLNHTVSQVERLRMLYMHRGYTPYSDSFRKLL